MPQEMDTVIILQVIRIVMSVQMCLYELFVIFVWFFILLQFLRFGCILNTGSMRRDFFLKIRAR